MGPLILFFKLALSPLVLFKITLCTYSFQAVLNKHFIGFIAARAFLWLQLAELSSYGHEASQGGFSVAEHRALGVTQLQ